MLRTDVRRLRWQGRARLGCASTPRRGYVVHPGNDGFPDAFGAGDVWALQYHGNEDRNAGGAGDEAHIDPYVNGESIADTDIVLWYATHARHDEAADQAAHEHGHIVGPTLSPFNW